MKSDYYDHLRAVPLFGGLDRDELEVIGRATTELSFREGETLMRGGAGAREMFVVVEGQLDVMEGDERIACIGAGGFAGEIGLLAHSPRSHDVVAATDVRVLHLDGRSFEGVLAEVPQVAVKMLPVVAARVVENSDHHTH